MRHSALAAAVAALLAAAAPAVAGQTLTSRSNSGAVAIAGGGGGGPLGNTPDIMPSPLTGGGNTCIGSWALGISGPFAGLSGGATHPDTDCQAREWTTLLMRIGITTHNPALAAWAIRVACSHVGNEAPAGVCPLPAASPAAPAAAVPPAVSAAPADPPRLVDHPYAETVAAEGPRMRRAWVHVGADGYEWADRAGGVHTARWSWDGRQWRWVHD